MTDRSRSTPPEAGRHPRHRSSVLPDDLVWAEGGHASDVVLTALADGQAAIVPAPARAHVDRCPLCTTHLGHAALLSLHVAGELAARRDHERATARQPLPRVPIALGLVVAALGLVPSVLDDTSSVRTFASRDLPLLLHGLGTLARRLEEPGSPAGLFVTYAAAVTLLAIGAAAIRLLPKKEAPR